MNPENTDKFDAYITKMYSREISKRHYFNINNNKLISHSMVLLNKNNNTNTSSKNTKVFPSLHISPYSYGIWIYAASQTKGISAYIPVRAHLMHSMVVKR